MEKTHDTFKTIYSCNPFLKNNNKVLKRLRPVQEWMFEINSEVRPGMKICDSCRKQLLKEKNNVDSEELDRPSSSSKIDTNFIDPNLSLEYLNKSLSNIEESPILQRKGCIHLVTVKRNWKMSLKSSLLSWLEIQASLRMKSTLM